MKKIIYIFILLMFFAAKAYAQAGGPHLWLSTDPANFNEGGVNYVGSSTNPWMADSYNAGAGPFRMYLYNAVNNVNAEAATNVGLLVAIHSGDSGVVEIKDSSGIPTLIPMFTYIDINPYYGGGYHGVYQNLNSATNEGGGDAVFALYTTNITLASNQSTYFDITTNGFREVHFDAFSSNGYYNPPSHDVTTTPEPATLLLLGMGLVGLIGLRKKKLA